MRIAIAGIALWSLVHAATNSIGKAMIAAIGWLYDHDRIAVGATASVALAVGAGVVMWSGYRVKSA